MVGVVIIIYNLGKLNLSVRSHSSFHRRNKRPGTWFILVRKNSEAAETQHHIQCRNLKRLDSAALSVHHMMLFGGMWLWHVGGGEG